ncbi:pilus assembly protein TadG-related protein [Streptomyces angustmyceticus]|uniref:pilus assembly protein TadG-related protein n=1 Tax=Streptomyces angustmyceticus TaxID=285578 RepID=UPI00380B9EB0
MPATAVRRRRDAGQAFPLYIVAVGGLLFLALAFFAVGQAAASRNGAQTAADAAALAAGQKYRDLLTEDLLRGVRDGSYESNPAAWKDLLNARGAQSGPACASAGWFAGRNDADLSGSGSGAGCVPGSWPTSFAVEVTTRKPVGDSVIPMTKSTHAEAGAKSVVAPRCTLDPAEDGPDGPDGKGDGGGKDGKDGKGKDDAAPLDLTCDGRHWTLDPDDLSDLPGAADLFAVRLAR